MISTDGGTAAPLFPLHPDQFNDSIPGEFKCFDPIDDEDIDDDDLLDDGPKKPETVFDGTGYGYDTFEKPETSKKKKPVNKTTARNNAAVIEPLDETITDKRRVEFFTRPYVPSDFDKNTMTSVHPSDFDIETLTVKREGKAGSSDPRPQWTPPKADNDNRKGKHTFPALDEARNNTLMVGRDRAHTLIQNEWAFDILLEVRDLVDAAAPRCAWLQHDGHGETDEHEAGDDNPGYGMDVKHDYGPSENKVKRLWEHGNDNEPSKEGKPWNLGPAEPLFDELAKPTGKDGKKGSGQHLAKTVISVPNTNRLKEIKILRNVGALEFNAAGNMTHFRDKKGRRLEFKTKTRGAKGERVRPKVISDPESTRGYDGAALPRNKKGELTVGFVAGKTGSSNSVKPDTLDYVPEAGPTHSSNDPWAAQLAADDARDDAIVKLSQCRRLVGDKPYDALTQAASGFRVGELCGGRLGNTTDSARGRNLLQFAIERITEERSRSVFQQKTAA